MSLVSSIRRRFRAWLRGHSYSFFSSLGALLHHRVGTLMTVLVLGIAILLPLGLWIALQNLDRLDLRRDEWSAITVFLQLGTGDADAREFAQRIERRADVSSVSLVSPAQGMEEFTAASGFGQSLKLLDENPLPWVMMVNPAIHEGPLEAEQMRSRVGNLLEHLAAQELVESARFDYKWLQRLGRLLELGRAAVVVLSLLFGLAVAVVVANTIRLDVAARAEEIEILALVGAGNSFIRQPFLYSGFWYGLLGGVFAVALMWISLTYLGGPLDRLLDTYGQDFELAGLDPANVLLILLGSGLLGLLGALIAVQRYLRLLAVGGSLGRR